MNNATILGIVAAVIGVLLLALSAAGVFWPATPITDPGMLWTSVVFLLFGGLGILLGKQTSEA